MTSPIPEGGGVTDLRSRLLAFLDEELEVCRKATKGPWRGIVRGDLRGSPTVDVVAEWRAKQRNSAVVHWAGFDSSDFPKAQWGPNAVFMGRARSGYERTLRALREEVERHVQHSKRMSCAGCRGGYDRWPCPTLTRIGAALEISEDR